MARFTLSRFWWHLAPRYLQLLKRQTFTCAQLSPPILTGHLAQYLQREEIWQVFTETKEGKDERKEEKEGGRVELQKDKTDSCL